MGGGPPATLLEYRANIARQSVVFEAPALRALQRSWPPSGGLAVFLDE
jgi:hypothetical protein